MPSATDEGARRTAAAKKVRYLSKDGIWRVRDERADQVKGVKVERGRAPKARARSAARMVPTIRGYYAEVFSASPEDRILMIRQGVPASDAKRIIKDLGVEQKVFYNALGLKTATVNRKAKRNDPLSSDESERLLGVAKLVGQLETIVAESGDPEGFDAPEWMSTWLREPLPALGGKKPISFLDTMEGQALVSDALARIQSGAYA